MKPFHFLILWLGLPFIVHGQHTDHAHTIKKAKKKSLTVFTTLSDANNNSLTYKKSYEEFDTAGKLLNGIYYNKDKVTSKFTLKYNNLLLTESIKEKIKLNEIEKEVFDYNTEGLLIKRTEFRNDKLIIYYKYFYSNTNQLDSVIWYDKQNTPQLFEYHTYENGRLKNISEKTAYGRIDGKTEFYYHTDGTLKEEKLYDGFGEMYEHMSYNDKGLITERILIQDKVTTTYTYTYSGNGLMKSSTKTKSNTPQVIYNKYKWSKKTSTMQ